jgi:hypothetical protein
MSSLFGSMRRLLLAPSLRAVSFAGRRFPASHTDATVRLEAVPQAVVCGFEWGIDADDLWEVERRLGLVEPAMQGFAFEGVAMAYTVLDSVRGNRTRELLIGPGRKHIFLTYIGIGFAMARLPRILWKKVVPDLGDAPYFPTMSWLAVDGYGFDRAYFDTRKFVERQRVPKPYAWDGYPEYFLRAFDQGVGRALWFIHGADAGQVALAVQRFSEARQPDLWSGVGLAATFAGGCDADGLAELRSAAGAHAAELGLGSLFALKARHYSDHIPDHTETAVLALAGVGIEEGVSLADRTEVAWSTDGQVPPYELWRESIRAELRNHSLVEC